MSEYIYRTLDTDALPQYFESISLHNYEFVNMYPVKWYTNTEYSGESFTTKWIVIVKKFGNK